MKTFFEHILFLPSSCRIWGHSVFADSPEVAGTVDCQHDGHRQRGGYIG